MKQESKWLTWNDLHEIKSMDCKVEIKTPRL